jgi:membrane protein implicated in regulation of membrane protease activity
MDPVSVVYLVLFLIGFCFAVVSFILSGLGYFGGHLTGMDTHGFNIGNHHIDIGNSDASGHASGDSSDANISPVSTITIAMFITAFGGIGFILQQIPGGSLMLSLPLAFISGFAIAGAAFYVLYRLFKATQTNSNYSRESLLGLEAEVITSIPSDGLGEIAYITKGSRSNAPARSEEHNAIPTHSIVRMTKIVGNIFYVREIPEELLRKYDDELKELEDTK